jgi:lysine-ketoglutarate reductase/saccharopine dehydrogenase-like protein (TIGR00300 family)
MAFSLPKYSPPDFARPELAGAPTVEVRPAPQDGVAPDRFHGTSNHPEYIHLGSGRWILVSESRMDCVLVLRGDAVEVVEARRLKKGDSVIVGRTEDGDEGIWVHTTGFDQRLGEGNDKFTFRTRGTRETPFSRSYDQLYDLLRYDRDNGYIVWVLGPAVAFDRDSRDAMQGLIESGFCHALLAGNALATHDLEAAHFRTGLGQDIYTQALHPLGHYNHLDILNAVRGAGSIHAAIKKLRVKDGIIYACKKHDVPFVLAGSIRDDGPLPEVFADAYQAQDAMRVHARRATTVIALATQLHSIAFGNMVPSYQITKSNIVRPVYFYIVDMSEFSADKLANRGSAQATAILTNVQDFMINLWNNLAKNKDQVEKSDTDKG